MPALGHVALAALRPEHLDELYARLLRVGNQDGKPLSGGTVRRVHGVARRSEQPGGRALVHGVGRRAPPGAGGGAPDAGFDPTDVEVYGRKKQGVAHNYKGQMVGRPHPVVWAEAGVVVAAELGDGRTDPRPQAPGLIRRRVAGLPDGLQAPIVRADSGFFDGKVAWAAVAEGCDFAIVAKRSPATWAAARAVGDDAWHPATDMTGADLAVCDYTPTGWPPGTRCIVRRVRVDAGDISSDGRSRRRRTIDPDQLALALDGTTDHVYAYSFICTNLDWHTVAAEWWFRQRALVEERIKDTKLGAALRHLPSGYQAVNHTWMWAALLAVNISGWLQTLTRTDLTVDGRAHGKRLRRELINLGAASYTAAARSYCGSRPACAKDPSYEHGTPSGP